MKKMNFVCACSLVAMCAAALVACGPKEDPTPTPDEGKTISLEVSGPADKGEFDRTLIDSFIADRKAKGDKNTYVITQVQHGEDKVDSEVTDWKTGPDVYAFASDKISGLFSKGALAEVKGSYKTWVEENNNAFGISAATFNDKLIAYPFTGDNTYYLQYDKRVFTEEDVKTVEGILKVCNEKGKKFGYNLKEGFWGGAALFTFGADYKMTFADDGQVKSIEADFDSEKGIKAGKALLKIMNDPAWSNTMEAPSEANGLAICTAGSWDAANYKAALGENYGCAVMPTVTIDGETKHLGAFLGGKLYGVNPQRAGTDNDRLIAAHELAQYLSGAESQEARFDKYETAPCNKTTAALDKVTANENVKVLSEQGSFAHAQTAVPGNFWTAPMTLAAGIADGTVTEENLAEALKVCNDSIKASQ